MEKTENAQEARRRLLILVLVMDMQARRANNDDINLQNLLKDWENFHKNKGASYKTQNNPLYNNAIKATEYIAKFSDGLEADAFSGEPPETIFPYYELAYFLLRGSFNADSVRRHLRKHFLFKSPRLLPIWERLNNAVHYSWNELEFHTLLKEVEAELTAQTITDLSVIFHLAALFIYMEEEQDFCPAFIKPDIATYFRTYLDNSSLDISTEFQKMEKFSSTKELLLFHYSYTTGFILPVKADNPKFTAIIEHYNKRKELWISKQGQEKAKEILPLLAKTISFLPISDWLQQNNNQSCLQNLPINEVAELFYGQKLGNHYPPYIYIFLKLRYQTVQEHNSLEAERPWFAEIETELRKRAAIFPPPFKKRAENAVNRIFSKI